MTKASSIRERIRKLEAFLITDKVKNTIRQNRLISKGDRIIIGVSGGPDSVALLYVLNSLKAELGLKLRVVHLDHTLRKNSQADSEFVKNLAQKLGISAIISRVNVKALAGKGSIEEIARNQRLKLFSKVARFFKADKVALGHNLDDQAETVLMRLLRGSGLYGLSAIQPKRQINGLTIIRPFLDTRRKDIEKFLKSKKIKSCLDESNLEDIYLRNKIRNTLLPLLERKYNKNIRQVLASLAESSASDYDYLSKVVSKLPEFSKKVFALKRLVKMHPGIRRMLLRNAICRIKGNTRSIGFVHIKELEDLIFNRPTNSIVDLPHGISVCKSVKSLSFYRR
ncbi:MAG: tRNA lysidine(34) synthetase TilS [Candidatus Omnitrophica bacterium]|nr:tRNA lysidine(34) synthetase TilS [Candidatus Omnitrophota bacterium]